MRRRASPGFAFTKQHVHPEKYSRTSAIYSKVLFSAVKNLDSYLASDAPLACPVEKLVQGPIGDALTHVGQIVMLRRMSGNPIQSPGYFTAEIVAGEVNEETFSA